MDSDPAPYHRYFVESQFFERIRDTIVGHLRGAERLPENFETKFKQTWDDARKNKKRDYAELCSFCAVGGHFSHEIRSFVSCAVIRVCLSAYDVLRGKGFFDRELEGLLRSKPMFARFCSTYTDTKISERFPAVRAIVSGEDSGMILRREVSRAGEFVYVPSAAHTSIVTEMGLGRRVLVQGGSGAGKTVTMLHAGSKFTTDSQATDWDREGTSGGVVVYMLAPSVEGRLTGEQHKHLRTLKEESTRDEYRRTRNAYVCSALGEAMMSLVEGWGYGKYGTDAYWQRRHYAEYTFLTELFSLPSVALTLCVDEAGASELVAQAMTQIEFEDVKRWMVNRRREVEQKLTDVDPFPAELHEAPNVTVRLLVGGTGVGASATSIGWMPDSFTTVAAGLTEDQSIRLVRGRMCEDECQHLAELIKSEPLLRLACCNPRLAVIAGQKLAEERGGRWKWDASVVGRRVVVSHCFLSAAYKYKGLNAMDSLSHADLEVALSAALRAYYFPVHHELDSGRLRAIATNYGLVIDQASWGASVPAGSIELQQESGYFLSAPATGRYEMSASIAIVVLLLMGDGALVTTPCGRELEAATRTALTLFVMGSRRESELVHLLTCGRPTFEAFAGEETSFDAVTVAEFFGAKLKSKAALSRARLATPTAVVVSRGKAPFADVVALFGGLAVLVQCHDFADGRTLTDDEVSSEMRRMGFSSPVKHVAGEWPAVKPPARLGQLLLEGCGVVPSVEIRRCVPVMMHRDVGAPSASRGSSPSVPLVLGFNALMSTLRLQLRPLPERETQSLRVPAPPAKRGRE